MKTTEVPSQQMSNNPKIVNNYLTFFQRNSHQRTSYNRLIWDQININCYELRVTEHLIFVKVTISNILAENHSFRWKNVALELSQLLLNRNLHFFSPGLFSACFLHILFNPKFQILLLSKTVSEGRAKLETAQALIFLFQYALSLLIINIRRLVIFCKQWTVVWGGRADNKPLITG